MPKLWHIEHNRTKMQIAGLIFDDSKHYLDHLGPFCALLGCPLVICEPDLAELAAHHYPDLKVENIPFWQIRLPKYTISCDTSALLKANFPHQTTQILWLPHGNSDKGWNSPFFTPLDTEIALAYGQKMIDFMAQKQSRPKTIRIGNFRLEYYRNQLFEPTLDSYLYAPTWDDAEQNNSFWRAFPSLAQQLPTQATLWVKLHPNTEKKFAPEIEILKGKYGQKNIVFLPDAPPIYPLLSQCSAYIGDMSSIGYDFLFFIRPMFFLNANPALPLHQCGISIEPETFNFASVHDFAEKQKQLYSYTFDPAPLWKEEIDAICRL